MALPYPTKVVLPFDIATAQDMNERHANDVALAAGTGLDDGAVTFDKIDFASLPFQTVTNNTTGTTTSTSSTATLSGGGTTPTVTVTVGASGRLLVNFGVEAFNSSANIRSSVTLYIDGGSSGFSMNCRTGSTAAGSTFHKTVIMSGITPGSHTLDLRYSVQSNTATFSDRVLQVLAI